MTANMTIVGRIGRDPDLRFSASGVAVLNVSVAVSRRKGKGDDATEETVWYDVKCFRELAEHVAESISTGDEVIAMGYIEEPRTYQTKAGDTRISLPFIANFFGPNLGGATAALSRHKRDATPQPGGQPRPAIPKRQAANEEPF